MKKILSLLLFATLGITALPAQVTVTCEGKPVNDGDVLTFYAHEDELFGTIEAKPGTEDANDVNPYAYDPIITPASYPYTLTVTVTTSDNAKNGGVNWCGITTNCADIIGGKETRTNTLVGLPANMNMHGSFKKNDFKTLTADVEVKNGLKTLITFTEKFVYTDKPVAGLTETVAANALTLNGTTLSYGFPTAATHTISLYGADGKLAKTFTTTAQRGSVSLAGLGAGVYVYAITEGSTTLKGGKLLLR